MADDAILGSRIRELRKMRGLSVETAAGLAGMSKSMLSYIEQGKRTLQTRGHIEGLAYALQTSPAELVGLPFDAEDPERARAQAHIDPIRRALVGTEIGFAPIEASHPLAELVRVVGESADRYLIEGDYVTGGRGLTEALLELHSYTADASEDTVRTALRALLLACHVATNVAKELGYPDLAWIAADRMRQAAQALADPVMDGYASLSVAYAVESYSRDLLEVERAIERLQPHVGDEPDAMQIYGQLHARAAYGCAIFARPDGVRDHMAEAEDVTSRVGDGITFHQFVGPTNLRVWRTVIAVEAGEGGRVREIADGMRYDGMPRRRQAMHQMEFGRGLAQAGQDGPAEASLLRAEQLAPVYVRNHPLARNAALDIRNRARRRSANRELDGLLHRMGLG